MSHTPDAYVELSSLIKKRSLQVFLYDPVGKIERRPNEPGDILCIVEDFDALALILVRRLDQPDVVLTMLRGHYVLGSLPSSALLSTLNVIKVLQELFELVTILSHTIELRRDNIAERTCLEDLVVLLDKLHIAFVIGFQTPDQISLFGEFSVILKMVDDQLFGS